MKKRFFSFRFLLFDPTGGVSKRQKFLAEGLTLDRGVRAHAMSGDLSMRTQLLNDIERVVRGKDVLTKLISTNRAKRHRVMSSSLRRLLLRNLTSKSSFSERVQNSNPNCRAHQFGRHRMGDITHFVTKVTKFGSMETKPEWIFIHEVENAVRVVRHPRVYECSEQIHTRACWIKGESVTKWARHLFINDARGCVIFIRDTCCDEKKVCRENKRWQWSECDWRHASEEGTNVRQSDSRRWTRQYHRVK